MDVRFFFRARPFVPMLANKRRRLSRAISCLALTVAAAAMLLPIPIAQAASSERVHVVIPGETLSELAEKYQTTTTALMRANGLRSPDYIRAGQRLLIDAGDSARATVETHVVGIGETVTSIAKLHGVSPEALAAASGLANPNRISIGQVLRLPSAAPRNAPEERSAEPLGPPGNEEIRLSVPYRSQFTGSPYEESDCGPATLGMHLAYYGKIASTASLRQWVMESTRYWGYDGGSDWKSLVYASRKAGLQVDGLYTPSGGYRKWSFEDIEAQLRADNLVMLLVRYRALPGHTSSSWWGDHYILVLGINAEGQFIYHDSAFNGDSEGAYRTIGKEALRRAWSSTSVGIQYSAMILRK